MVHVNPLTVAAFIFCVVAGAIVSMQAVIMWEEYVAPHIRSWRYERRMEKARQAFLASLEKEVNKE